MKELVSSSLVAVAAIGLALAPISAQAATRAGDNAVYYAPSSLASASAIAAADQSAIAQGYERYWLIALFSVSAMIGGVVVALGSNASNGAN